MIPSLVQQITAACTPRRFDIDPDRAGLLAAAEPLREQIKDLVVERLRMRPTREPVTQKQADAWRAFQAAMGNSGYAVSYPSAHALADAVVDLIVGGEMSRDPFKITEPTCISFSGGRTSAYMLWRVMQSNDGLPADCVVCFANTGKEEEATLRFVQRCSEEWGVPIVWVEYAPHEETRQRFKVVNFETASRNGEPLEAVIRAKQYLPNPVTRFCTVETKIRTMHRYLRSQGWADGDKCWNQFVGIRADEPRRVAKIRARPSPETTRETMCLPLADANIRIEDVGEFWSRHLFNLELPTYNGRTLAGNCDLCLAGETEVVTNEGIKAIRDLAGGTHKILVPKVAFGKLSEVGSFKEAPIRSFGFHQLWKITLAGHGRSKKVIHATADHRWFLTRTWERGAVPDGEVATKDLMPGDRLRNLFRAPIGELRGGSSRAADFFWLERHKDRFIRNSTKQTRRYGWTVLSVEKTDRVEEVFCATVDGVGAFGLADGLMTGNCFLKPANQVFTLIKEKPERAIWWAKMEALALALASKPSGAVFRSDRPGYQQMLDYSQQQVDMFDTDEEGIGCFCGD